MVNGQWLIVMDNGYGYLTVNGQLSINVVELASLIKKCSDKILMFEQVPLLIKGGDVGERCEARSSTGVVHTRCIIIVFGLHEVMIVGEPPLKPPPFCPADKMSPP